MKYIGNNGWKAYYYTDMCCLSVAHQPIITIWDNHQTTNIHFLVRIS